MFVPGMPLAVYGQVRILKRPDTLRFARYLVNPNLGAGTTSC
jgi:hypothetical protein